MFHSAEKPLFVIMCESGMNFPSKLGCCHLDSIITEVLLPNGIKFKDLLPFRLTINEKEIAVESGTTIIQAAEKVDIFIPHYCWHPALSTAGSCRLCLVEIEGAPKQVIACGTPVAEGMVVKTESEKVKHDREIILEFLLLNHPLDCPICDKAGECRLQNYSFEYGKAAAGSMRTNVCRPLKTWDLI